MTEMINSCYFYGVATPYVYECIEIAARADIRIEGYIHNRTEITLPGDLLPLYTLVELEKCNRKIPVVFPMITPGYRKIALAEAKSNGFLVAASLVDPSAIIAGSANWAGGLQVNAGVVIGARCSFGIQVLVNRSASVGHDVVAGDYVTFGPGCVISGSCRIGKGTFIGAGAVILPGMNVGENCIIGGGAVVVVDVPDHSVIIGNPGRILKSGIIGYQDVSA